MWGKRAWTCHLGQFALSSHSTPSGSLTSHFMLNPSSEIFPWQVTLSLGFTSCNSSSCNSKLFQTVPFPIHSKTQRQLSCGTHAAVLALTGLEEPPTACGVPLASRAKSSPPSVLVRLQENLHRGNSTPVESLLRTLKTPHNLWAHPFRKEIWWYSQFIGMFTLFLIWGHSLSSTLSPPYGSLSSTLSPPYGSLYSTLFY